MNRFNQQWQMTNKWRASANALPTYFTSLFPSAPPPPTTFFLLTYCGHLAINHVACFMKLQPLMTSFYKRRSSATSLWWLRELNTLQLHKTRAKHGNFLFTLTKEAFGKRTQQSKYRNAESCTQHNGRFCSFNILIAWFWYYGRYCKTSGSINCLLINIISFWWPPETSVVLQLIVFCSVDL